MIIGSGIDIGGDPAHPALHGSLRSALSRSRLHRSEQAYCLRKRNSAESFAARFAAKEAGAKALGTGISYGVNWLEIEVVREPSGRPSLRFHGRAAQIAARLGLSAPRFPSPIRPKLPRPAWSLKMGNRSAPSGILKASDCIHSARGDSVPSRKEIQWSQLRVGALVLAATAVLIGLIFLMSGSTGGLFARKFVLRCYFENAAGVKNGAPVTLEGVTIGNVIHVHVVPDRNPTPVEVTMQRGLRVPRDLHVDSTASIAQAGVLGDSYVDIDSTQAAGPPPENNAELKATGSPSIQDVIRTSQVSIQEVQCADDED